MFIRIFAELTGKGGKPDTLMIDATHLKARHTAASLLKRGFSPTYWQDQGRSELEASCRLRRQGRPLVMLLSEGQMNDYKGAALMLDSLCKAKTIIADKG